MADQKAAPAKPKAAKAPAKAAASPAPVKAAKAAKESNQKPEGKPADTAKPELKAAPAAKAQPAAPAAKVEEPKIVKAEQPKAKPAAPAPAVTKQTGAKSMTETINKTREAADQAAEQFRSAFGNVNEQSKAALEKSARVAEELADLTRGNIEALVASQKTAAKYAETLSQGAADFGRRSFEEASTALKSFAEVKSPTDLFRLQSEYARSAFDQLVAESARVSETVVKMTGDVVEPITSRYSVAAERIKTLAA
ncbi:MAG: phasin family protein [Allosphingosinicella sp.]|uniref:phasin family protein n=1 Tax=Allosphingosinicella sp. TaxID=2823234 RepID=UPI003938CC98